MAGTYSSGVDGEAVVLIFDICSRDCYPCAATHVESIGVVTTLRVTSRVIDGNTRHSQVRGAINGKALHRSIFDVEPVDRR